MKRRFPYLRRWKTGRAGFTVNFNNFEPDTDWIEDIGIVGAVNWQQLGTGADFLFQQINYFLSFLWVEFETQFETPVFITPWVINVWQTSAEFPTEPYSRLALTEHRWCHKAGRSLVQWILSSLSSSSDSFTRYTTGMPHPVEWTQLCCPSPVCMSTSSFVASQRLAGLLSLEDPHLDLSFFDQKAPCLKLFRVTRVRQKILRILPNYCPLLSQYPIVHYSN